MKDNIELGQTREFSDIISDTFVFLRQNFSPLVKSYFIICGPLLIAGIVISVLLFPDERSAGSFTVLEFVQAVFMLINYTLAVVTTLSYMVLYREKENQTPTLDEVWAYVRFYYFRALGSQLIIAIMLAAGMMFCFIPGIYLFPILSLIIVIIVMENTSFGYAIKKAFKIIKENWWLSFGVLLIMNLLIITAFLILTVPVDILLGGGHWLTGHQFNKAYSIVRSVVSYFDDVLYLVPTIALVLLYFTLIEVKEAQSLTNRIKNFGVHQAPSTDNTTEEY